MRIESWAWLVVPLGASRAMQIVLWDRVLQAPRGWVQRRFNPHHLKPGDDGLGYIGYLYQCPWCTSVWIGLAIVLGLVFDATRPATLWMLTLLAISLAAVVVDRLIDVYASDEAAAAREHALTAPVPPSPPPPIPAAVATAFDDLERPRMPHDRS